LEKLSSEDFILGSILDDDNLDSTLENDFTIFVAENGKKYYIYNDLGKFYFKRENGTKSSKRFDTFDHAAKYINQNNKKIVISKLDKKLSILPKQQIKQSLSSRPKILKNNSKLKINST